MRSGRFRCLSTRRKLGEKGVVTSVQRGAQVALGRMTNDVAIGVGQPAKNRSINEIGINGESSDERACKERGLKGWRRFRRDEGVGWCR